MKKKLFLVGFAALAVTSTALASQWTTSMVPSQVVVYQGCGANLGQGYAVVSLPNRSEQYSFRVDTGGGREMLDIIRSSMDTGRGLLFHLGESNDPKVVFKMTRSYGCADSPIYTQLDAVAK
jgi:hypothetical protein